MGVCVCSFFFVVDVCVFSFFLLVGWTVCIQTVLIGCVWVSFFVVLQSIYCVRDEIPVVQNMSACVCVVDTFWGFIVCFYFNFLFLTCDSSDATFLSSSFFLLWLAVSAVSLQFVKLLWSYHILLQFLNHKHFLSYIKAYHFISWGICFSLSKQQSSPIHVSPFHVHTEFNLYIFSTVSFHCCMKNKKNVDVVLCLWSVIACDAGTCCTCSTQQVFMNFFFLAFFFFFFFFFGGGGCHVAALHLYFLSCCLSVFSCIM